MRHRVATALVTLPPAAHGLEPDARGEFELAGLDLETAIAACGWRWTSDTSGRPRGAEPCSATVWQADGTAGPTFVAFACRGKGPTEAAALARVDGGKTKRVSGKGVDWRG